MITKKGITYLVGSIFLLFFTLSCKEKEVTITKDYVINPNWDEDNNAFEVYRMTLKDSGDSINLKDISPPDLLQKLVKDTSFSYSANVVFNGLKYSERKVYFDEENGFLWHKLTFDTRVIDVEHGKQKIGELKGNTWYSLTGLSNVKTLYYVYIDKGGSLHSFKVPASYWTNY